MMPEDWNDSSTTCLGMILAGDAVNELDERGNSIIDDTMLMLINAHWESVPFVMPQRKYLEQLEKFEGSWVLELDTTTSSGERDMAPLRPGETYQTESRSIAVFRFKAA